MNTNFSTTICISPAEFKTYKKLHTQSYAYCITDSGILHLSLVGDYVVAASFIVAVGNEYATIQERDVSKILLIGTDFQHRVWHAVSSIPAGMTLSYQELAITIGQPQACRAVARALATNPLAYFIPCHRVVRKDGDLGGYKWGIELKRQLLRVEL